MRAIFIRFLIFFYFIHPSASLNIFSIQESLTVLCYQFPLVNSFNNSGIQCSRLRVNENIPTSDFNHHLPVQLSLFMILDQSSATSSSVDISIDFTQSLNSSSSIDEINFSLLVIGSNFTINNQTTVVYSSDDIPVFNWRNSTGNFYTQIDIIRLDNRDNDNEKSLCKWKSDQWVRILHLNTSSLVPYVYFLKSSDSQFSFTLFNPNSNSTPPSPLLNILYCVPYRLGVTEIVLLSCFSAAFIAVIIILSISHYLKSDEENRTRHFELYHNRRRNTHHNPKRYSIDRIRHRSKVSIDTLDQESDN